MASHSEHNAENAASLSPEAMRCIDIFKFIRQERSVSGSIAVTELPRLMAEVPVTVPPETVQAMDPLRWSASGFLRTVQTGTARHASEEYWLDTKIEGQVWLICQRCLTPYLHDLSISARYRLVETEEQADAVSLDDDEGDVIVGSYRFNLTELIEEEIFLSLPLVPKHSVCPDPH